MGEAGRRAEAPKATLFAWEAGRTRPRGPALLRLLDALETDPRLRARLLHAADPQHARFALVQTPLGAPVNVGMVIRAMRGRRGETQGDLARAVGVTQAAVARWEAGEDAPSRTTIHAVAHALGASFEETVALDCAQGRASGRLPDAPYADFDEMNHHLGELSAGGVLSEVVLLGLEAELWPRAARDARWDVSLGYVVGNRALRLFLDGRLGEAEETARRALRLAPSPQVRLSATFAFSALLEVATHRGADPAALAEKIESWTVRLPEGHVKDWMRWERGLRLAEMGRADEAVEQTERDLGAYAAGWPLSAEHFQRHRARGLMEIELRAGRGDRAEALLPIYERVKTPDLARWRIRIAHARGHAADEAAMTALRSERLIDAEDNWYTRDKIARIEREQARLARVSSDYFATSS